MLEDEGGERLGPHQRGVAGQDQHVAVVGVEAEVVVGEAGQAHGDGVARAALDALLDELERHGPRVLLQRLDHQLGAVAHDHHGPIGLGLAAGHGVEHVPHERAAAQHVQRLGPGRAHARALAGRQHHGEERAHAQRAPLVGRLVGVGTLPAFMDLL